MFHQHHILRHITEVSNVINQSSREQTISVKFGFNLPLHGSFEQFPTVLSKFVCKIVFNVLIIVILVFIFRDISYERNNLHQSYTFDIRIRLPIIVDQQVRKTIRVTR